MSSNAPPLLDLHAAASMAMRGGVVAYPTEAVWGLGCDPHEQPAVMRLLQIKQREVGKGLILIAANIEQLVPFAEFDALPADCLDAVLGSWPGPNTWIVPAAAQAPRWITGDHDGIAVRVSAHPPVIALCNAFGGALVSTSANPAGAPAPATAAELSPALLASIDGVLAGETGELTRPTVIRDARTGATLRL